MGEADRKLLSIRTLINWRKQVFILWKQSVDIKIQSVVVLNHNYCQQDHVPKLHSYFMYIHTYSLSFFVAQLPLSTFRKNLITASLGQKRSKSLIIGDAEHVIIFWGVFVLVWAFIRGFFLLLRVQYKLEGIMCFIKKLELDLEPVIYPCEHHCYFYQMQFMPSNHLIPSYPFPTALPAPNFHDLLQQMATGLASAVQRINANNSALLGFAERLIQSEALLQEAASELQQGLSKSDGKNMSLMKMQVHCELNQIPFFSNQPIISKIFGHRDYRFRLNLAAPFPRVIYKQRNLNIPVRIANPNGQPLLNANLIHLCVGVCNAQGQWIVQESGDFFIQGKMEIDLYHGQAEFKKVSPKDVSRHFSGGVVSIIIYPKKSLLNFTGEVAKYEKIIDPELIEPLVIRDVVIKAKKKAKL